MNSLNTPEKQTLNKERYEVLQQIEDWLETPMLVLGLAWLVLFLIEVIWGLSPLLEVSTVIWLIFILDFALKFTLAPRRIAYLKRNWLTAVSLLLPALRVFRIARVLRVLNTARATRGLQLVRIVTSTNRGMRSLGGKFRSSRLWLRCSTDTDYYPGGSSGMYVLKSNLPDGSGLKDYGSALWWTAMLMTTLGSEYWPQTPEGRVLCFLLALYAFAVFGYLTAAIATFFVGRDAESTEAEIAGANSIKALHDEIAALRADIQASRHRDAS